MICTVAALVAVASGEGILIMYLLPMERTPGDYAHINNHGVALCGVALHQAMQSEHLCAFNACPECDRIANGVAQAGEWQQVGLFEVI